MPRSRSIYFRNDSPNGLCAPNAGSSSITISGHPILTDAGIIAVRLLLPHAPPIENMIRWRVILLPNMTVIEPIPVRKKSRQVHRNMLPVKDSKRSRSGSTTVVIAKIKLAWMNFVSASSEGFSSLAFFQTRSHCRYIMFVVDSLLGKLCVKAF